MLQKFRNRTGTNCAIFVAKQTYIVDFLTSFRLGLPIFEIFWTTVGLGLSFKKSGLGLDRKT